MSKFNSAHNNYKGSFSRNANKKWNIKYDTSRSGKIYSELYELIACRVSKSTGNGQILIIGESKQSVIENVIYPMIRMFSTDLVSIISEDKGTVNILDKLVRILSIDEVSEGSTMLNDLEYVYGDGICDWSEHSFNILSNSLNNSNGIFDGVCFSLINKPWLIEFIDTEPDLYAESCTIYDSSVLNKANPATRGNLSFTDNEYYRYIMGDW